MDSEHTGGWWGGDGAPLGLTTSQAASVATGMPAKSVSGQSTA